MGQTIDLKTPELDSNRWLFSSLRALNCGKNQILAARLVSETSRSALTFHLAFALYTRTRSVPVVVERSMFTVATIQQGRPWAGCRTGLGSHQEDGSIECATCVARPRITSPELHRLPHLGCDITGHEKCNVAIYLNITFRVNHQMTD